MVDSAAFVLKLPEDRVGKFLQQAESQERFGQPVEDFELSRRVQIVVLVSTESGIIDYIGRGKRGIPSGTDLRRLNILNITKLTRPIRIELVTDRANGRTKAYLTKTVQQGGLMTPAAFDSLISILSEIHGEAATLIARFRSDRPVEVAQLSRRAESVLALEKESVVAALSLARMPLNEIAEWTPPPRSNRPLSFLAGLPSARLMEDQMIIHDLQIVPGWDHLGIDTAGAASFSNGDDRLTVVHANKLPLEEVLGVDLIYFNERFQSFVMVQYKALDDREGEESFRLPNQQLTKELQRMETVWKRLTICPQDASFNGWRMNPHPFFLKFCPRTVFQTRSIDLIRGMYFPVDYWTRLAASPDLEGERGGRLLKRLRVGRYLSNSAFLSLVGRAWIGTTPTQSKVVADLIKDVLEAGHAVTVAVDRESLKAKQTTLDDEYDFTTED